jgi:hypothetical protein
MDYFAAVQEGRSRVKKALDILQEVVGPCSPVLFLKTSSDDWTPVGEENLFAIVTGKNSTAAVVLCDGDGNSKAMSGWVSTEEAEVFGRTLGTRGLERFDGEVQLPI